MKVELVSCTPEPEQTLIEIARVSSSREDKREDYAGLINYLINNRHWSPFEHAFMTMKIVTSKAIGIQLLRHRSFTFQEFSQRYAEVTALEPMSLRLQAEKNRQSSTSEVAFVTIGDYMNLSNPLREDVEEIAAKTAKFLEKGQELYIEMLQAGIAKECARMILPMTTQTTIYMSGTIRSWIHMLDIRDDSHAQLEAQLIAKEMKKIFIEQCPTIAKARGWA